MYPQMHQQAGWDLAHAEHMGHASVTSLRTISESEGTESFVLAPAIISGVRCLATVSEAGHRFILPGPGPEIRKAEREFRSPSGPGYRKPRCWCNLATCADFMYPGSGGFSPAVQNLSSGALDYWIECNLASCIEFMYPGSAGLIATPVEPSSAALEYCRRHFSDKDEEFARGLFMA
ncbi:hypothetical protein B0H13DRAFT_1853107 [Mycena leptocephala]|nr:hypothetical protein B0H13DRAFT_1853107 [Mycena leptocephala]